MPKCETHVYYKNPDGTIKRVHVRANSRRELNAKCAELKKKEQQGINISNSKKFGFWADKWMNSTKMDKGLSAGTEGYYKYCVELLKDEFADVEFRALTMDVFQDYINRLAKKNPHTGKPTSARYLRHIRSTAKNICLYASGSHVPGTSAFYSATIPKNAPKEVRPALNESQVKMVEEFEHPAQLYAMIACFSGLRRGEVLALQWKHIDLDNAKISVVQSLNWEPNQPVVKKGGKTKSSTRTVVVPPVLVSFLKKYKSSLSVIPAPGAVVVADKNGEYLTQSRFRTLWKKYMTALNMEYGDFKECDDLSNTSPEDLPMKIETFTTHQCRHFFCTLLYLEDFSVADAMAQMGHKDCQTTMNIYTDLKTYSKSELSDEFRKKLLTTYRINLNPGADEQVTKTG